MKNRFIASLAVLTLVMAGVLTLRAQTTDEGPGPSEQPSAPMEVGQSNPDNPQDQPDANAPAPDANAPVDESAAQTDQGVARVSMIHGDVSTQRGDSGDWSAAILNAPVMGGDKVSTGDNARVELQLDFANILRLGPGSQANISNLTKSNIQIQLSQGIASYTVFKNGDAEPEIDTPNVSIHPSHNDGVFRVEVQPDGDTVVTVRKGEAQISTPQGSTEIRAGEMATVRGSANDAQYKISDAAARDDFDRWNNDRDRIIETAQSSRHTNRYYVGSQDLDTYGRWKNVPDYGDVWVPDEPADWAPYRDGNWVYEPYYGWTWVGYEPWGWAPYHYGRWMMYGGAWGWWPGPVYGGGFYRPLWAPAYVSFFGWGGGFGFGVGFGGWGGFGWLPIGPCDFFHPWWGGFGGRFGFVGFHDGFGRFGGFAPLHGGTRFSNVSHLSDPHIGRALSTVGAGQFGTHSGRAVAASGAQISGARMATGNLPVVPSKASLSASGRAAAPSTVRNGGTQHFFGNSRNMAHPASFQQQTAHLQQAMQQNHVASVQAGGRENASAGARGPMATGSLQKPSAGTPAVGREINPSARNTGNQAAASQNANRGGNHPLTAPSSRSDRPSGATGTQPQRSMNSPAQNGNAGGNRPFTAPSTRNDRPSGATSPQPQRSMNSPAQNGNPGGYRPFTPPSNSQSASQSSRNSGSYWNRTAPSSRGSSTAGNYGRPQLDMRQPVVRPRSSGNGGYRGSPGYPANRGAYGGRPSAPSYGGRAPSYGGRAPSYGRRAPSYGGRSSAPSGGGHPSGGGGHSSGGSGGHSSGGGGGHSSGGGGGHSGGGHH